MKRFTWLLSFLMLGLSMSASAGWFGFGGTSWKEEVLLHDGSKLIVERTAKRHGRHELFKDSPIGSQSISFAIPGTARKIVWKDEYSEDVGGANFNLMLLDIVQGTTYVLATPAGCQSYNKWGRPNPPYVIFKYQGNEWRRIPLQELPVEIKQPNMLHSSPDIEAEKRAKGGVVSAQAIRDEIESYSQPEFRSILREGQADARVTRGCMEEVRTGDGWMSLDWFSSQKTREECMRLCERKNVAAQNCPCNKLFKGK